MTLIAVSAVFVFSASARITADYDLQKFYTYPEFRQLIFCVLAVIIMFAVSTFNYRWLGFKSFDWVAILQNPLSYLLIVSIILLIAVLIPGIGTEINYARRWLRTPVGPITINFQPSELAKWVMILFLSAIAVKKAEKSELTLFFKCFVPIMVLIGLVAGLILLEDFGTAAFVAMVSLLIVFIAGGRWWHFLTPIPAIIAAGAAAIMQSPERIERVKVFFCPGEGSAQAAGYQVRQSLIAISTGEIFGKGIGSGISKYGHLPEDTTDFIFAIIAEELGFIGVVSIILLFVLLIVLGIMTIRRSGDNLGKVMAFGITFAIATQAAVNLGVVTRLLPTKGIALPFISAGGSHLLLTAAAVGILMNIARKSENLK